MSIPNTRLTERLRVLWECTEGGESWEDWYARQCAGGTPNGRALAALLFDRARNYWPDYFSPADTPALVAWGDMFDRFCPFATPEVVEMAVDNVHARGIKNPGGPAYFLEAARAIIKAGDA